MASAHATKTGAPKKSHHPDLDRVSDGDISTEPHARGAPAGLPLFLRSPDPHAIGLEDDPGFQFKLLVNPPHDTYEQEADRTARAVNEATPAAPRTSRSVPVSPIATRSDRGFEPPSSGTPLSSSLRERVEPVLNANLEGVRVHAEPQAREMAHALHAKAFTHGTDIYLGPGQSPDDVDLLAHESTHVVQQTNRAHPPPAIQRKVDVAPRTDDGEEVRRKMMRELDRAAGRTPGEAESATQPTTGEKPPPQPTAAGPAKKVDRAKLEERKKELQPQAKPSVDRVAENKPKAEAAANAVKQEVEKAPEKGAAGGGKDKDAAAGEKEGGKKGAGDLAASAADLAQQAFALADEQMMPDKPAPVEPPPTVIPLDAAGKALAPDPAADAGLLGLANAAQQLRAQGLSVRHRAAEERSNAAIIRGNIGVAEAGIKQADTGMEKMAGDVTYRREVSGKATAALKISEAKAEMVAQEAPTYQAKAEEGKKDSGPMASESKGLVAENAANTPDDEEAAAKSQEQGSKLNSVGSDIGSMDDAITQTKTKAENLSKEAADAKQSNAATKTKVDATDAALAQTDEKIGAMKDQNAQAQARLSKLKSGPAAIAADADALDQQALAIIASSFELEGRIQKTQQNYDQGMRSVPASKAAERLERGGGAAVVQRTPEEGRYDERVNLDLGGKVTSALPSWLTGEEKVSEAKRLEEKAKVDKRRNDEIAEINAQANGNFGNLSDADKAGIALKLTARHIFNDVGGTNWPNFAGHLIQGLVDPRVSLMGIVSGLSMTLSGVGNLLSAEQWKKDPLGNLLKSAADIATGITIILGSITALALAIIIILTAAAILTLGLLGPVAAAVIPFCSTVVSVVGGWTITAAAIALELHALCFIKNLMDAATASTAADLQNQSDQMTEDAKNAGNMALQIGLAKAMEAGGKALGGTKFGQAVAAESKAIGEDFGIVKPPGGGAPAAPEAVPVAEGAPAPKPAAEPAAPPKPAAEPAAPPKPAAEPAAPPKPAAEPAAPPKPAAEPAAPPKPAAEPPAKPVEAPPKPVAEPKPEVIEPPAKPVAEPKPEVIEPPAKPGEPGAVKEPPPEPAAPKEAKPVDEPTPTEKPKIGDEVKPTEEPTPPKEEPKPAEEAKPAEKDPEAAAKKSAKDQAIEETQKKIDEIQQKKADVEKKLEELDKEIFEANKKLQELKKTAIEGKGAEKAEALKQHKTLKEKLEGLKDEQAGTYEERAKLNEKINNLTEALKLERPSLRESTKEAIRRQAEADGFKKDGKFVDPNTGKPIEPGQEVFGHKPGHEHRRLALEAQAKGMNQSQFNDWVNSHPEWFQIEDFISNSSHAFEKPGFD